MKEQSDDTNYLLRGIRPALVEALADTPVVCLLGPRQCGKSTLARLHEPDREYLSLDQRANLDLALKDPEGFLNGLPERVTIDEVQRAPELTLAIKLSVDENRRPGRFLLTGSANLLQLPRLSDSLAGRMECLSLHPFTESEKEQCSTNFLEQWMERGSQSSSGSGLSETSPSLAERITVGGYPEAVRRAAHSPRRARTWQKNYLESLIERDIHDVASVKDGEDVTRLLEYLSQQTGQLLNISTCSTALGHTRATVERYLGILEKLFLIRRLPAWHNNRSKRLVKTPKLHLWDSGLAASLSNLKATQWNDQRSRFGLLLESFVLQQLIAMASWMDDHLRFYHYRDKDQVEVDIVIESGNQIWGIEVKTSTRVNPADGKGLNRLRELAGSNFQGGVVFYNGTTTIPIQKEHQIYAVPLSKLWQE